MSDTLFVKNSTKILATWLNDVNTSTYSAANKAALAALTPALGLTVFVSSSDGGLFKAVVGAAALTYSDNGGSYCGTVTIPIGGDGSIAWVSDSDQVTPAQFGAVGDGVTDDTVAIQAGMDYAQEVRATSLSEPLHSKAFSLSAGSYLVTDTLFVDGDNFTFRGEGQGVSNIVRNSDYGNTFELQRPRETDPTGHIQYTVTLKDFTIESLTRPTTGSHIQSKASRWLRIQGVDFAGGAHRCIDLIGANRYVVSDCNFIANDSLYSAFTPVDGSAFIRTLRNGLGVTDYSSFDCEGNIIDCDAQMAESINCFYVCYDIKNSDGTWITNAYAKNAQYANYRITNQDANTRTTGVRMVNCWGDRSETVGIIFEGVSGAVNGNHVVSTCRLYGGTEQAYGIVVNFAELKNVTIVSNQISSNSLEGVDLRSFDFGVDVLGNVIWEGNLSNTAAIPAIHVDAGNSGFKIQNNTAGGRKDGTTGLEKIGVLVDTGASDNYMITDNSLYNVTGTPLTDNGTGVNKVVANNLI